MTTHSSNDHTETAPKIWLFGVAQGSKMAMISYASRLVVAVFTFVRRQRHSLCEIIHAIPPPDTVPHGTKESGILPCNAY